MAYEVLRQMLEESQRIMVFSGVGLIRESGISYFKDESYAYEIEAKYGISPEEFLSSAYYNTRPGPFYKYYKEEFLRNRNFRNPNEAHYALARLEQRKKDRGGLVTVATRTLCGLHQKAGVENVIELHGNMYYSRCTKCGKEFSVDYVLESPGIPQCNICHGAIRPGILLAGERLDNGLITKVANETEQADLLLVVATHLDSYLTKRFKNYYHGNKLVLVNDENHPTDREADLVVYGKPSEILPQVID